MTKAPSRMRTVEPIEGEEMAFLVSSFSEPGYPRIVRGTLYEDAEFWTWECDCPGGYFRRNCAHITATLMWLLKHRKKQDA